MQPVHVGERETHVRTRRDLEPLQVRQCRAPVTDARVGDGKKLEAKFRQRRHVTQRRADGGVGDVRQVAQVQARERGWCADGHGDRDGGYECAAVGPGRRRQRW